MSNEITLPKWSKDNYSSYHEWAVACYEAGKKEAVNERQKLLKTLEELINAAAYVVNSAELLRDKTSREYAINGLRTAINNAKSNNQ